MNHRLTFHVCPYAAKNYKIIVDWFGNKSSAHIKKIKLVNEKDHTLPGYKRWPDS